MIGVRITEILLYISFFFTCTGSCSFIVNVASKILQDFRFSAKKQEVWGFHQRSKWLFESLFSVRSFLFCIPFCNLKRASVLNIYNETVVFMFSTPTMSTNNIAVFESHCFFLVKVNRSFLILEFLLRMFTSAILKISQSGSRKNGTSVLNNFSSFSFYSTW